MPYATEEQLNEWSATQRLGIHKILKAAVKHLVGPAAMPVEQGTRQEYFICHAIDRAAHITPRLACYADNAKAVIQKRIFPYGNVKYWLEENAKIPRLKLTYNDVQDYRHRWLQALIKEFSE